MCGIAGIVGEGAEQLSRELAVMSKSIAHRGPDGEGSLLLRDCAFAHRRLSIIDRSNAGAQPMQTTDGRFTLVFNGMIYNYIELRRELRARGVQFRGDSDSEVLLQGLGSFGAGFLDRLNGMFSFGLWDAKDRQLLLARDRFGEKPLVYVERDKTLYFASEASALLAVGAASTTPDQYAIADFAADRVSNHGSHTFFRDVQQLPAGSALVWRAGKSSIQTWWRLALTPRGSYETARTGEIAALLEEAIALRLRADTPVGCMLSGGLDSTYVASVTQRRLSRPNQGHVFSTVHVPSYEEADGIDDFATLYPEAIRHVHTPTADQFWEDLPQVLLRHEQPFADASMVAHFALMRRVRQTGVPVVLGGQAADEIFAGYPGHLWMHLGVQLGRRGPFALPAILRAAVGQSVQWRTVLGHALPTLLTDPLRRRAVQSSLSWLLPEYRQTEAAFQHTTDGARAKGVDRLDQALAQAIEVRTLPGFLHYQDRNAMAFGVEGRLPFLDHRLVERLFRTAPEDKLAGGITKRMLRDASAGVVPQRVWQRLAKQGYPAPLARWLRTRPDRLRSIAADPDSGELLNLPAWSRRLEQFLKGNDSELDATWRGLVLVLWRERFRAGAVVAE